MSKTLAAVLMVGSAVSMPLFDLANLTFTGDRVLGIVAVLFLGLRILGGTFRWTPVHTALAVFVAVQVLTTLLNARTYPHGVVLVTVYVLGFACFALTADVTWDAAVRRFAVRWLIVVGAVVGFAASVLAIVSNLAGTQLWGTTRLLGRRTPLPVFSAHVTFSEPNYLGGFLLIPFALYLWRSPEILSRLAGIVLGIVYSATRAAWLGMGCIVLVCIRVRRLSWRATLRIVGLIAMAFAFFVITAGLPAFMKRTVLPFTGYRDRTTYYRVMISEVMLRSWLERPLIGHGAGAGSQLRLPLSGGRALQGIWAANAEVHLLQNSGLLGLGAFVLVIGVVWREVRRAARTRQEEWKTLGVPLTVAAVFLVVSFQFTHALWLMYPYVFLGLFAAELSAAGRQPPST